jgi:hypothetical protein
MKRNWIIRNQRTGQVWNGSIQRGWTDKPQYFSSLDHAIMLPLYGIWENSEEEQ